MFNIFSFLPVFTLRDGEDSHKIIIEPHFYLENKSTDGETLQYNVQRITNIIERYIRKYPKEWVWILYSYLGALILHRCGDKVLSRFLF